MLSEFKSFQVTRKKQPRFWFSFVMLGVIALDDDYRQDVARLLTEQIPESIRDCVGKSIVAGDPMTIHPQIEHLAEFSRDVVRLLPTREVRLVNRALNNILREMRDRDEFGSEGQSDPRGDHRT